MQLLEGLIEQVLHVFRAFAHRGNRDFCPSELPGKIGMNKGARLQFGQRHAGDEDEAGEACATPAGSRGAEGALFEIESQAPLHAKLDMLQAAQHDRRVVPTKQRAVQCRRRPCQTAAL